MRRGRTRRPTRRRPEVDRSTTERPGGVLPRASGWTPSRSPHRRKRSRSVQNGRPYPPPESTWRTYGPACIPTITRSPKRTRRSSHRSLERTLPTRHCGSRARARGPGRPKKHDVSVRGIAPSTPVAVPLSTTRRDTHRGARYVRSTGYNQLLVRLEKAPLRAKNPPRAVDCRSPTRPTLSIPCVLRAFVPNEGASFPESPAARGDASRTLREYSTKKTPPVSWSVSHGCAGRFMKPL